MSKVHDVDPNVIQRTQQWLAGQQQADGSWKPDTNFINEGATNRYNSDVLRITAYIAWSLENTGYQGPAVEKARQYVAATYGREDRYLHPGGAGQFRRRYGKDRDFTTPGHATSARRPHREGRQGLVERGRDRRLSRRGAERQVETTGLAVQALLKWGEASGTATQSARAIIASKKDASAPGALRKRPSWRCARLLLSTEKGAADVRGAAGDHAQRQARRKAGADAGQQRSAASVRLQGHRCQEPTPSPFDFNGKGGLAYQVVGRYFRALEREARARKRSPSTWLTTARDSRRTTSPPPLRRSATIWPSPPTW